MLLAYFINIIDSTFVYTVVIYHIDDIGTFDRCIYRIYNDIINYCCYTKCEHARVRVYAIVTVARPIKKLGSYWNTFCFLKNNNRVLLYQYIVLIAAATAAIF